MLQVGAAELRERCLTFDCLGHTLLGILHEPVGSSRDIAILIIVGGPQYRVGSHRQFVVMARQLASSGYAVLRFDYRGMGDSAGEPRSFETVDADIVAAIDTLYAELPGLRGIILFGLCDAASAALMYRDVKGRVSGMILANPWVRTESGEARAYVRHYYRQRLLQRSFWCRVISGRLRVWQSIREFMLALRRSIGAAGSGESALFVDRMLLGLQSANGPVLLLMSGSDLTAREFDHHCSASPEWSRQLSSGDVLRVDLPGADHTFSSSDSLEDATKAALAWLRALAD